MNNRESKINQFVTGSMVLILSGVILKAFNFFLLPLYTKYLTPEQLGISDTITSMTAFIFPILVFAFDSAFSAFYYEQPDEEYKNRVFNTTFFFLLFMSCFGLVMLLFTGKISNILFKSSDYQDAIILAILTVVINLLYLPFSLLTRMRNRMMTFSIINTIASLSMILLNIYFIMILKRSYISIIASTLIVQLLQLVMYAITSKVKINYTLFDRGLFKHMIKYALPLLPVVISSWILSLSDRYMLLYYKGEYEVGIYGVASRFLNVLSVITNAIYTAYTSFAFSVAKDEDAKDKYVDILDGVFFILMSLCFTVSMFSREIILLMVEESYYYTYKLVAPLLYGQVCYAVNTIIGYGFAHKKKSEYYLIPVLLGAIINIILNVIFIPVGGAYVAAMTTFIGYLIMMLLTYFLVQRVYKCGYHFKRIIASLFFSYIIYHLVENLDLIYKLFVWLLVMAVFMFSYRKVVKQSIKVFLEPISRKRP